MSKIFIEPVNGGWIVEQWIQGDFESKNKDVFSIEQKDEMMKFLGSKLESSTFRMNRIVNEEEL